MDEHELREAALGQSKTPTDKFRRHFRLLYDIGSHSWRVEFSAASQDGSRSPAQQVTALWPLAGVAPLEHHEEAADRDLRNV
jgi:hypothetical protein